MRAWYEMWDLETGVQWCLRDMAMSTCLTGNIFSHWLRLVTGLSHSVGRCLMVIKLSECLHWAFRSLSHILVLCPLSQTLCPLFPVLVCPLSSVPCPLSPVPCPLSSDPCPSAISRHWHGKTCVRKTIVSGGGSAPIDWTPTVSEGPEWMLENMQISLLSSSCTGQETESAKPASTRSCSVLCDKLEFICAAHCCGGAGEGLSESVNYSIQIWTDQCSLPFLAAHWSQDSSNVNFKSISYELITHLSLLNDSKKTVLKKTSDFVFHCWTR